MAHGKAWLVLAEFPSSSSDSIHEVRRGGDGVLYCLCPSWRNNKPASGAPKMCKHTKLFVQANPGTSYGPQYGAIVTANVKTLPNGKKTFNVTEINGAPVAAGGNWRALLLAEKEEAVARVKQAPDAFAAYARELELD